MVLVSLARAHVPDIALSSSSISFSTISCTASCSTLFTIYSRLKVDVFSLLQDDGLVKMVVGKTLDKIVMDDTKDVFLFVIPTLHL